MQKEKVSLKADNEIYLLYNQCAELEDKIRSLKEKQDKIKEQFKKILEDNEAQSIIDDDGKPMCTTINSVRISIDSKKLKIDYPDIFDKYKKESNTISIRMSY